MIAEILIVSSGTAVSQGREAIRLLADEGLRVGLVKVKSLRPWPYHEIREATRQVREAYFVPEFNVAGWMAREIKATIADSDRVIAGPHVAGGMTMPPEVIVEHIQRSLGKSVGDPSGSRKSETFDKPNTWSLLGRGRRHL